MAVSKWGGYDTGYEPPPLVFTPVFHTFGVAMVWGLVSIHVFKPIHKLCFHRLLQVPNKLCLSALLPNRVHWPLTWFVSIEPEPGPMALVPGPFSFETRLNAKSSLLAFQHAELSMQARRMLM